MYITCDIIIVDLQLNTRKKTARTIIFLFEYCIWNIIDLFSIRDVCDIKPECVEEMDYVFLLNKTFQIVIPNCYFYLFSPQVDSGSGEGGGLLLKTCFQFFIAT